MITKAFLEKLSVDCGHAINHLNGRSALAESVLCRVTSLCAELLNARSDSGQAVAARPDDPTLSDILNDLNHRGGGACIHVGLIGDENFTVVAAVGPSADVLTKSYESLRSERHFDVEYPDVESI